MYDVTRPDGKLMMGTYTQNLCEMELGLKQKPAFIKGVSLCERM
jgi:hypothetical protein